MNCRNDKYILSAYQSLEIDMKNKGISYETILKILDMLIDKYFIYKSKHDKLSFEQFNNFIEDFKQKNINPLITVNKSEKINTLLKQNDISIGEKIRKKCEIENKNRLIEKKHNETIKNMLSNMETERKNNILNNLSNAINDWALNLINDISDINISDNSPKVYVFNGIKHIPNNIYINVQERIEKSIYENKYIPIEVHNILLHIENIYRDKRKDVYDPDNKIINNKLQHNVKDLINKYITVNDIWLNIKNKPKKFIITTPGHLFQNMGIVLSAYEEKYEDIGFINDSLFITYDDTFNYTKRQIGLRINVYADKEYHKIEEIPYFESELECCICM